MYPVHICLLHRLVRKHEKSRHVFAREVTSVQADKSFTATVCIQVLLEPHLGVLVCQH
jgi:hypothetical protein